MTVHVNDFFNIVSIVLPEHSVICEQTKTVAIYYLPLLLVCQCNSRHYVLNLFILCECISLFNKIVLIDDHVQRDTKRKTVMTYIHR